jgi:hypothetical protein
LRSSIIRHTFGAGVGPLDFAQNRRDALSAKLTAFVARSEGSSRPMFAATRHRCLEIWLNRAALLLSALTIGCGSSGGGVDPTPTVTRVAVTGAAPAIGSSSPFTATAVFSNGAESNVTSQATWDSSNKSVATVSAAGVVTGVGGGDADISASYQGVPGQVRISIGRTTFTVSGNVTDGSSKGALPNVLINLSDGKSARTDANGGYSMSGVSAGTVTVTASATGYDTTTRSVAVSSDTRVDIELTRTAAPPTPFTASINVLNTPCTAPSSGAVTCRFSGSAAGAPSPFTFNWRFTNPANNQAITATGQEVQPELGCNVSSGVVTFNLSVSLTATGGNGASTTVTGSQQIARLKGACGT